MDSSFKINQPAASQSQTLHSYEVGLPHGLEGDDDDGDDDDNDDDVA